MKCERAIAALTTGGAFDRWRAHRHLQGCPHCEAESACLRDIARILAEVPPISRVQRAIWIAASTELRESECAFPVPWRFAVGLAAGALLISAMACLIPRNGRIPREVVQQAPSVALPGIERPSERERVALDLLAQVDHIESDLADLRRRADLLDIRHEADALWSQYSRFEPPPL